MTSEIAILNKMAVALAADSAVSIGSPSLTRKTYNSANKLFSLSKHHPVGVMIYNSAEFMGVPWETLIKMYRSQLGKKSFPRLSDYAEHFKGFLRAGRPKLFSDDAEARCRYESGATITAVLSSDIKEFIEAQARPTSEKELQELVLKYLREFAALLSREKPLEEWNADSETAGLGRWRADLLKQFADDAVLTLTQELENAFLEVCAIAHVRGKGPASGIVIAGFGGDDVFPSVVDLRVHGVANNRLGHGKGELIQISDTRNSVIRPFAQREMVNTFMDGIHPEVEESHASALRDALLEKYPTDLSELLPEGPGRTQYREFLVDVGKGVLEQLQKNLLQQKRQQSRPVLEAVRHLEREDLASLAESLLQLTSLRKRVSLGPETVGGPIDVAVISKGDGFVWMKRKHYFDPRLNFHFFSNYLKDPLYGTPSREEDTPQRSGKRRR